MSPDKGSRPDDQSSGHQSFLNWSALSHVGMLRSINQDAYCALVGSDAPPGIDALLAVADGMGGHLAGEVASAMAIQGLVNHLSADSGEGDTITSKLLNGSLLDRVVQEVNTEVHQASMQPDNRGMGTTLTVVLLKGSKLHLAHVGDSRAYLLRAGELRQLTQDHSWVAEEVARGTLTPQEAQGHPRRNIITRSVGINPGVQVDTGLVDIHPGDLLLVCSDGLHSMVTDEVIEETLTESGPQEVSQSLVDIANSLGGHDNITVIAARLERLGSERVTSDPITPILSLEDIAQRVDPPAGYYIWKTRLVTLLLLAMGLGVVAIIVIWVLFTSGVLSGSSESPSRQPLMSGKNAIGDDRLLFPTDSEVDSTGSFYMIGSNSASTVPVVPESI